MSHSKKSPRVGKRGAILLLFSVAWAAIGLQVLIEPAPDAGQAQFYALIDPQIRLLIWFGAAIIGSIFAFRRSGDWPGFIALMIPPLILFASNALSFYAFLQGQTPYFGGFVSAIRWSTPPGVLLICCGWAEVNNLVKQLAAMHLRRQTGFILTDEDLTEEAK